MSMHDRPKSMKEITARFTRRRPARATRPAAACLALAAALGSTAGCSSSSPVVSSAPSTSSAAASASASALGSPQASATAPNQTASAALLTPSDLGAGFSQGSFTPENTPLPCAAPGSPSLNQQVPPSSDIGRRIVSETSGAYVVEQVRSYAGQAEANAALAVARKGVSCQTGKLYATDGSAVPVTIAAPQDITSQVAPAGFGTVQEWSLSSTSFQGLLAAGQHGSTVVFFTFIAPQGSTNGLPSPDDVIKKALEKLQAVGS